MASLRKDRLIWVDLKTTGLNKQDNMMGVHKHKIIEIGLEIIVHHNKNSIKRSKKRSKKNSP